MSARKVLWIVLGLTILLWGGVFFYLTNSNKKAPAPAYPSTTFPEKESAVSPVPITPYEEKIPFDYEVLSASDNIATLKGERGEASLPNSANVKVFKGAPDKSTPANFSDLAKGQKLKIERTIAAGVQEVRVYILL